MVRLKAKDASILARVAQYDKLPENRRDMLLNSLEGDARKIGLAIVGKGKSRSKAIADAAARISAWARHNRSRQRFRTARTQSSFS
jgi:hypothetical protein